MLSWTKPADIIPRTKTSTKRVSGYKAGKRGVIYTYFFSLFFFFAGEVVASYTPLKKQFCLKGYTQNSATSTMSLTCLPLIFFVLSTMVRWYEELFHWEGGSHCTPFTVVQCEQVLCGHVPGLCVRIKKIPVNMVNACLLLRATDPLDYATRKIQGMQFLYCIA